MPQPVLPFDHQTQQEITAWLEGPYDSETKEAVKKLVQEDPKEALDAFYKHLEFGTAGMRGIMGVGPNRFNFYTVRMATQGLAQYLKQRSEPSEGPPKVLIGFDSRHHSIEFAREAAQVLAGNGIEAYLFGEMRPVALISFGCQYLHCDAAVILTASHNPPEYNGYKVYWKHGGQLLPPHDQGVIEEVATLHDPSQIVRAPLDSPLIHPLADELDQAYYQAVFPLQTLPQQNEQWGETLHIVYTPLHGSGITMVPPLLRRWGFTYLSLVAEQTAADGAFPTVTSPNPEDPATMAYAVDQMMATSADIALGTDPDCDRVGICVRHHDQSVFLDGNQIACLALFHLCFHLSAQKRLMDPTVCVKTIVTSELFRTIAEDFGIQCLDVLTGFKYIGEKIEQWSHQKEPHFLFAAEESYGTLLGTHARDKDGILTTALLAEMALDAKRHQKTLIDNLYDLYNRYGVYKEEVFTLPFPGKSGSDHMGALMAALRTSPPEQLSNTPIITIEDYLYSHSKNLVTKKEAPLSLPPSNVLLLWLDDKTKVVIRPSGTEPKIKFYYGVHRPVRRGIEKTLSDCEKHITTLHHSLLTSLRITSKL